jgi:two-component system, NtrC family, C4-dicarboxylate transport sensor histidine kinase DctB
MNKEKNKFNFIIASLIVICFILLIISEIFLFTKIEDIQKNQYKAKSQENNNLLTTLIDNKKNATLTLAIAISQFETIQNALEHNDYEKINLNSFSSTLEANSDYKNIWIQVISKEGVSKYRSWTNKKNDSLLHIREDLRLMLKNPQIMSTISVGIFDMTFKSMVPLFKEDVFLGVVEVITHFNSITRHLQNDGIMPLILVNKKYKSQFLKPLTDLFIDDYYVANLDVPQEILDFVRTHKVETFWDKSSYMVKNPYFISFHKEVESQGDTMATFLLFQKLDDVKSTEIASFKNLSQLIIMAIFSISIIVILFFYFYLKRKEESKTHQILQKYNEELEEKINFEIESSRKKDMLLANQSKLVALGEMLGNIAHQWRQPLSAISTATSGLQIKYEYDLLTKEEFIELTTGIVNNTKYLSDTIEDFRDFFKKDKEKHQFNIALVIKNSYSIIKALYNINTIKIEFNLDESIEYFGFKTELSQVFLNLFNNAKDALLQNHIQKKIVYIKLYEQKEFIFIEFHDNAGGVKDEINNKIFDPYFTTKHQTQGTGIGLFMSNEIISKHFKGEIYNENATFSLDNEIYMGANFIIKLPKNSQ